MANDMLNRAVTACLNIMAPHDGPLREGLPVRICCNNDEPYV